MKNTMFAVLALSGSLFGQAPPSIPTEYYCPYFGQELIRALALSPDQCRRISLVHEEGSPELEAVYARLQKADNTLDNLRWTEELSAEEAGRAIQVALVERRKFLAEAREAQAKKNRLVLGVLSAKQRQIIDQLVALAPTIRIFNDAMSAGLIPFEIANPIGSGQKGSTGDRMRSNQ